MGRRVTVEALGLLEMDSIAAGVETADAMAKMAPVEFVDTFMVSPGKFVVIVHGDPSSVRSSLDAGEAVAAGAIVDRLYIPFLDAQVLPAIRNTARLEATPCALGFVETLSVASGVQAADDAAKAAEVIVGHLYLGRGIGGKSVLMVAGPLHDVQAAVGAAAERARGNARLVTTRVIAQPDPDLWGRLRAGLRRAPAGQPGDLGSV
jgi:microcompartment protein CcmL/EutN